MMTAQQYARTGAQNDMLKNFAKQYAQSSDDVSNVYEAWLQQYNVQLSDDEQQQLLNLADKEVSKQKLQGTGYRATASTYANRNGKVAQAYGKMHDPQDEYEAAKKRVATMHGY